MEWCADCERLVDAKVIGDHGCIDTLELACPYCDGTNVVLVSEDDWREDR